jgi:hypothetical protein
MLIPNKFNGYRRDGTRNLYIGGGIGEAALLEAMLTGAAVGGGSSLIQGKDPLQGALLGGLTGGAFSGLSGAFGGAASGAGEAVSGAMPTGVDALIAAPPPVTPGFESFTPTATQFGAMGEAPLGQSFDSFGNPAAVGSPAATMADPSGLAQQQMALNAKPPGSQGIMGQMGKFFGDLTPTQKLLAGGAGIAGLGMIGDQMRGGVPKKDPYSGALSRFNYNPDTYIPYSQRRMAEGGIAASGNLNLQIPLNLGNGNQGVGSYPASGGFNGSNGNVPQAGPSTFPAPLSMGSSTNPMMNAENTTVGNNPLVSGMAGGGIASLGSYSDGGRMLKGPGDGMSDNIPATIGGKQPARLADGEFVIPADVVSHLGNGSTDAGAKQLYAMMNKVRKARTGRKSQGREISPHRYMPA